MFFFFSFFGFLVVLQTVIMAANLNEGSNIEAEYSSYFEDKNNNEVEYSISDPDYVMVADPLAKAQ